MSKTPDVLAVGGPPRSDLLPPEIRREHKGRRTRRKMIWGILGVVILVFVGTGTSYYFALSSQIQLALAQARTNDLLVEQQKYTEVRGVQDELATVEAGQRVGAATEVDWKAYIDQIEASLPANVAIMEVVIDGASPMADYLQPEAPLQGVRVATLRFGAWTTALPDTDGWLVALSTLPGYTDANPDSITFDEEVRLYETYVTMHIDEEAWSERYVPEEEKEANDKASDEAESEQTAKEEGGD